MHMSVDIAEGLKRAPMFHALVLGVETNEESVWSRVKDFNLHRRQTNGAALNIKLTWLKDVNIVSYFCR